MGIEAREKRSNFDLSARMLPPALSQLWRQLTTTGFHARMPAAVIHAVAWFVHHKNESSS